MKTGKGIRAAVFIVAAILFFPVFFLLFDASLGPCYDLTYYAELPAMVMKLRRTEGKKIVLVGNSAVAFGADSAKMEESLRAAGLDYSVCNFGLYGLIGTKAMMDLSLPELHEGDIAVLIPEQSEHALSLWSSGEDLWKAIDTDKSLFLRLPDETKGQLLGSYAGYVSQKYRYRKQGIKPETTGVYAKSSFNENCDLIYPREYNTLLGGADSNSPVSFHTEICSAEFTDYVNAYAARAARRGAAVCFAWCPINRSAVLPDTDPETIGAYFDHLDDALEIPVISDPNNYLLDCEWFYDSNFHMNSAGSVLYTRLLTDDLKSYLGCTTPADIDLPAKPELPEAASAQTGDDSCEGLFLYEENENGYTIIGRTEAGLGRSYLVIPTSHEGRPITDFSAGVFQNDTALETLVIQSNIRMLYNDSFRGSGALKTIELRQPKPSALSVGLELLSGTENVTVLVPQESIADYLNDYFWGHYAGHYQTMQTN